MYIIWQLGGMCSVKEYDATTAVEGQNIKAGIAGDVCASESV